MDAESEEFTPPSSPVLGYSGVKDHHSLAGSGLIFCLSCKGQPRLTGQDNSFSPNGYILRRELISAIDVLSHRNRSFTSGLDNSHQAKIRLYSIFGRMWDPMDFAQLKTLIAICRKQISTLEILCNPIHSYGVNSMLNIRNTLETNDESDDILNADPWKLRKEVCLFLNIILSRMTYYQKNFTSQQLRTLFNGMKRALGRTESWSGSLKTHCGYRDGNECTSGLYHGFHLNLELRWSLLIINSADSSTLSWIFQDLIYLSWFKYITEGNLGLLEKQPFNCWCVKEIWTMIRLLIDELEKNFWEIFEEEMKKFMSEENTQRKDIFFAIWLTVHLASLSDYNLSGVYIPGKGLAENNSRNGYKFINLILKEWARRGGKTVEINKLIQKLLCHWGFDLDVIVLFWNHWIPKIDKCLEAKSLEQYNSVDKWLKLIEDLSAAGSDSSNRDEYNRTINEDSFLSFLKLLVGHARRCKGTDWKKLKSHIGMKLNKHNVEKYSEIGILRVSTLYMALANVTFDTAGMCDRLKEILEFGKPTIGRKKTILRAMATTIIICLKKSVDICLIQLTQKFMDSINELMSQASLDSSKKDLIMIYLDLLDCLPTPCTPQFSTSSLSRQVLISPNLTMWLSTCGPNYVVRTLRILNKLTTWILSSKQHGLLSPSDERDELANRIDERTIQFLTQEVILNSNRVPSTDVEPMANLAADLTLLSRWSKGGNNDNVFIRHFDHFVMNERTCPEVSQHFLCRLYSHQIEIDSVFTDIKWIQVWIRLNALGCCLPEELNARVLGPGFSSTSNELLLKRLCKSSETWSRGEIQNILNPLATLAKSAVGGVYKDSSSVMSTIVRACAIVLKHMQFEKVYVKGDSVSVGHRILDALIPLFVGTPPWEKLPRPVVSALRHQLFYMLEAVTDCNSPDPYLLRKIQDMFTFAFLGFLNPQENLDEDRPNPGIEALKHAEDNNVKTILDYAIPQLCTMQKDAKLTQRFVLAVNGLKTKKLISAATRFLSSIITIYVTPSTPADICNVCAGIVTYCCTFGLTPNFQECIIKSFEKAMGTDFAFRSKRFFELSGVLTKSPRPQVRQFLRLNLLPLYKNCVEACERRRGSGNDNALRTPLEKLERETVGFDRLI